MQEKTINSIVIISILILGVILRLALFYASPINNSFDDHLEVIKIYVNTLKQPFPSQCWECYQPPLYYIISSIIFKVFTAINFKSLIAWKMVQFINTFLSIWLLLFYYKLLNRINISKIKRAMYLSFLAVLPIDLFT